MIVIKNNGKITICTWKPDNGKNGKLSSWKVWNAVFSLRKRMHNSFKEILLYWNIISNDNI